MAHSLNLGKRTFSVAAPRVWNEFPITLKTSATIAIFRKKHDIYSKLHFQHKCSVVPRSETDFARPCSRLCLMILFCCASELRLLRYRCHRSYYYSIVLKELINVSVMARHGNVSIEQTTSNGTARAIYVTCDVTKQNGPSGRIS